MKHIIIILAILLSFAVSANAQYTFTELLPGTTTRDINNDGVVVGGPDGSALRNSGFIYSNDFYTNLLPADWNHANALGINSNGEVVGSGNVDSRTTGFLYSNNTYTEIRPSGWGESVLALDINDSGDIVGYGDSVPDGSQGYTSRGYLYSGGSYTELLPSGWTSSKAHAINDNGDILGSGYGFGNRKTFIYNNGIYTEFQTPGLSPHQTVVDINNNGDVIGHGYDGQEYFSFLLYSDGSDTTIQPPGWLEGGPQWPFTDVRGLNNNGDVVGVGRDSSDTPKAFLYSSGTYTEILPPGWLRSSAWDINDNGTIVGWGYDSTGTSRGFIASPVVPEPISSILFITGGGVLGIRRFIRGESICVKEIA